ncbi:DNA alkylation repair protein [Gillisia sp. M10.2A]|uniref:DNA alkylation repair protein n=1 Tax=Gillisia lutea TaxID=2909668 RepID=A0ABS9EHG4_9FLAO|nr:DNA alkylation repair protein [Gillisia lutea]MCF4100893.1 DNA alkylation repair protein [Gillisia lutea]
MGYILHLEAEFQNNANENIAVGQKAYMRNQFKFFGIKTPLRREIQKPFLVKQFLPPKKKVPLLAKELWDKPEREYQFFAQELVFKYVKEFEESDIELFEFMIIHKSWWDTVDFIAVKLVGSYLKKYPQKKEFYVDRWLRSNNIWLQRTAIIFQLKYKTEVDTGILEKSIQSLLGSKEFFINKAIGWMLREYSKTNPVWVREFVKRTALANQSKKEALRLMRD